MPENIQDIVLLKTDSIPTYHFAHAVDDHFMRTTHVTRGDEWISSVPTHIQLFSVCGFKAPKYAHISPIMKEENGSKRKLSKRKDPEAAVTYYAEEGFPKESVIEYLLTLANSNFEDWRRANPDADCGAFPFNLKKMSVSGALFDLTKLTDVSKNVISKMSAKRFFPMRSTGRRITTQSFIPCFQRTRNIQRQFFQSTEAPQSPERTLQSSARLELMFHFSLTRNSPATFPSFRKTYQRKRPKRLSRPMPRHMSRPQITTNGSLI